jgi:hypothetical protein
MNVTGVDAITMPTKLSVETDLNALKPLHRSLVATNVLQTQSAMPGHGGLEETAAVKTCVISSLAVKRPVVVYYIPSTITLAMDSVMDSK